MFPRSVAPALLLLGVLGLSGCGGSADAAAPVPAPEGMVRIDGGTFEMGRAGGSADEGPVHTVEVSPFLLDVHEVTNRDFAAFVRATGHETQAERDGYAWAYLEGATEFARVKDADWRRPEGPGSSIAARMDHPVVCVSWEDAKAYAEWAGRRLPTEAEWELAARAGSKGHAAVQGPKAVPGPERDLVEGNVWQGVWPEENELDDGYFYTSPVGRFAANGHGVHDMLGNVWEWCADWYGADWYAKSPAKDPTGPESGDRRVARGGSWFCSENYCGAYSTHFRGASPPGSAFNNVGFRCAKDAAPLARREASR